MKVRIVTVGKVKDPCLRGAVEGYLRRIRREADVEVVPVRDTGSPERDAERLARTLDRLRSPQIVVLGEEGEALDSRGLAARLGDRWRDCCFVIGGPDGLHAGVKERAHAVLSLSPMTLPHEMALLVLAEQIFRALTILGGRSYHRDG